MMGEALRTRTAARQKRKIKIVTAMTGKRIPIPERPMMETRAAAVPEVVLL